MKRLVVSASALVVFVVLGVTGALHVVRDGDATAGSGSLAAHGGALRALDTLTVKGKAPLTGYQRDVFGPAWTDDHTAPLGGNGCRTRDDILARDLHGATVRDDGCTVMTGVLFDPYSGLEIHFVRGVKTSANVQIDHVVALANAWQSGAWRWTDGRRVAFANDPLGLLAVSGVANAAKGKSNAAEWLPPNKAFRCEYVARQIAVKAAYGLSVTAPEKAAMQRVLTACPDQRLPTG